MSTFEKIRVVCFGGGTGLPALLSGLKQNPWLDVTAIVSMFDSGGSSGELRDRFGILPPGDILKCLLALSEDEVTARKILQKRIQHRELPGHTGGNVLLMALEKVYGKYTDAIDALGQILSIQGRVIPVSLECASLCARYEDGTTANGEIQVDDGIEQGKKIDRLFLEPSVRASTSACDAIVQADVFCVGPGSFYTSVLPNFLPEGIQSAIKTSKAPIIFICNLLTEGAGMQGDTIKKIVIQAEHFMGRSVTHMIANQQLPETTVLASYATEKKFPLMADDEIAQDPRLTTADLWTDPTIARHDSARLAQIIFRLSR